MKRLALLSAAPLLLLAACSDETQPERTPTAPAAAPTLSRSAAPATKGLSTVCMSYMTQLANTQEKLEKKSADAAVKQRLEKKAESLDKLVADACR